VATDGDDPEASGEVPLRARGWGVPLLLLAVVTVVVAFAAVGISALLDRGHEPETVTFVVPAGTGDDIADGKEVDLMPPEVDLQVGDTIVVRNDDAATATVGPFTVRPGETLQQTFRSPMTLVGECTLSGTGEVKIVVT
jgi:hypothetical protein